MEMPLENPVGGGEGSYLMCLEEDVTYKMQ